MEKAELGIYTGICQKAWVESVSLICSFHLLSARNLAFTATCENTIFLHNVLIPLALFKDMSYIKCYKAYKRHTTMILIL